MYSVQELTLEEKIKTDATHVIDVDFAEIKTAGAVTSLVMKPLAYKARDIITFAFFDLVAPFVGAGLSAMTVQLGYDGASVDDDDAFIEAKSILSGATPILADAGSIDGSTVDTTFGAQEVAVINSLRARAPFAAQEAGDLALKFTSTSANLSVLTAGRLRVFVRMINPTEIRPTTL
jgi:hypothetical protein